MRPAGPVRLPDEVRPMLPVSFFFTEVVGGQDHWPASVLRASWATNQGERAFEPTELKDYFGLLAGDKLPVVTVAEPGRSGAVLKLEIKQAGFAWWTVQLGRANWETSDERPYLRNGRLELAVRGEVGEEAVRVGLVDAQETPEVAQVLLTRHATLTKDWQLVRVPLRELKAANPKLDWSRVKAVQIASAHGRPLTLYLDDIRIVNPVASED
ncbi:MAG: hypothetical protein HUU35_18010 [Armatimonadetes bacterium]|nr:hypothetical protein [Armatimonadota bacterium]